MIVLYIARQPIFNKELKVYGYELLFRADQDAKVFTGTSATSATATVLDGLYEIGIEKIVDGKKAFVNFDYDLIVSDAIELFDPKNLIIEVLEDIVVDDILSDRLKQLKDKGYRIALDDFVEGYDEYPLVPIANIIKYDIMATPLETLGLEVKKALRENKVILAEKVETKDEFIKAKKMGFHLFQGYFFSKPSIIGKSSKKESTKAQYMRLITELKKEEPSYQQLTEIMKTDVKLSYRLLKIISNKSDEDPVFSIKKALVKMGFKEIERWINILMMRDLSEEKPEELTRVSLIRSSFGEFISENSIYKNKKIEISMICLLSVIDAVLDLTMEEALEGIILTDEIKQGLTCNTGGLNDVLILIKAYEDGEWEKVAIYNEKLEIDPMLLSRGYLEAIAWTHQILSDF